MGKRISNPFMAAVDFLIWRVFSSIAALFSIISSLDASMLEFNCCIVLQLVKPKRDNSSKIFFIVSNCCIVLARFLCNQKFKILSQLDHGLFIKKIYMGCLIKTPSLYYGLRQSPKKGKIFRRMPTLTGLSSSLNTQSILQCNSTLYIFCLSSA